MSRSKAIVKYEADKWSLAKYRAEKRLSELKTVEDRLMASKMACALLALNSLSLGWSLAALKHVYDYVEIFFGSTDLVIACGQVVFLSFNFLLILFTNNFLLKGRFAREEMKRLNAEEAGLMMAKKRLERHPDNAQLRIAYDDLVSAIRSGRKEDSSLDE